AGESIAANAGGLIPDRPRRTAPAGGGIATPAQLGRAVYEQTCQACHGPELKGDRGPELDSVVSRLGPDATRNVIMKGRGTMPAFASLSGPSMAELMAFLAKPDAAPIGSAPSAAALSMARLRAEPDYPEDVSSPPSRYKTGYGNESYIITPPWSTITAYDLNTGKIKWQSPYGDLPQAGPGTQLRGNAFPKSGFVITAGGFLLFAGNDSKLYALDKDTGKLIFSKELPNGSLGVPAVYEVNGREYILMAVSGGNPYPAGGWLPPGGKTPATISRSYIAFALPPEK
ncbi:MAG: c-type cytochrome, partial [Acidobacteriota bacterium]